MYLKSIHIENYRLLRDVTISLDKSLTLFVGKNNTGKTSVMQAIEFLLSSAPSLSFDDYPLDCRQKLYTAVSDYWHSAPENPIVDFQQAVPVTKVTLVVDYSDNVLGNVSEFIIDLNEGVEEAVIQISFDVHLDAPKTLDICKQQFDSLIKDESTDEKKEAILHSIVKKHFTDFFKMNVVAANPTNREDILEKNKSDLQNLFFLKVIRAERNMDESEMTNPNPLEKIMKTLFSSELEDVEAGVQQSLEKIQALVADTNINLQEQINAHMATIVQNMLPFGYPAADDLQLRANTNIDLERRIREDTELTYISTNASESLPSSHNGLGYKNLIKISLELHEFARAIKNGRTKLPILFLEEPEAHMHPQLQSTFVAYIEDFLAREVGAGMVQVLITTHSAHVANTVEFNKVRYIRRHANRVECKSIAKFPMNGTLEEQASHLEFLQKYMKLSYCDLYFCDKAILVEGASERLLIPDMLRKCKEAGDFNEAAIPLTSQYYTIVEVGGAYAHHFYDFVDYLEIPTLILTDIDFVKGAHGRACQKVDAEKSSNGAINRWCRKVLGINEGTTVQIEQILGMTEEQYTDGYRHLEFQKEENGFHPRSLEDAIMNCNRALFKINDGEDPDFANRSDKKTDFALKLLMEGEFISYHVPSYIRDGLIWLNNQSRTGGQ